jgi:hypothetical protein
MSILQKEIGRWTALGSFLSHCPQQNAFPAHPGKGDMGEEATFKRCDAGNDDGATMQYGFTVAALTATPNSQTRLRENGLRPEPDDH